MESLCVAFEAVMPVFLLMAVGYVIKALKIIDKKTIDEMNKLVFKIFLPVLLFYNIYGMDTGEIFDGKLVLFTIFGILGVFVAGFIAVLFITKDNSKRGTMLQAFFRSNYAILGLPLIKYICGESSGALSSLMVAVVVPFFNVLAVVSLEFFRCGKVSIKKVFKGVITNPLIISCVLGLLFFSLDIKLVPFLDRAVLDLSHIATPLALVVLGASFTFSSLKGYVFENIVTVTTRLVIVPLIMLTLAALCGIRGEAFACVLVTFGAPVAVSSFSMAQQMDGDEVLAGQSVVLSSAFCIFTLFVWIFVFSHFGMF